MTDNKPFSISSGQLFFILFTVRLYSLLLNTGSVTDYYFYFTFSLILSITAEYLKSKINQNRIITLLVSVIAFALMIQTVVSYVLFTNDAVHPDFNSTLLIILIVLSVVYSASLGTEAIARFSVFCGLVLVFAVLIMFITNADAFRFEYINAADFTLKLSFYRIIKCLDLPVIYIALAPYVKGDSYNSLRFSIAASYGLEGLVLIFVFCVTGTACNIYNYPTFTLFCLSHIGSFSRLDILFTSSVLLGLFLKCSVLLNICRLIIRGDNYKKNNCRI